MHITWLQAHWLFLNKHVKVYHSFWIALYITTCSKFLWKYVLYFSKGSAQLWIKLRNTRDKAGSHIFRKYYTITHAVRKGIKQNTTFLWSIICRTETKRKVISWGSIILIRRAVGRQTKEIACLEEEVPNSWDVLYRDQADCHGWKSIIRSRLGGVVLSELATGPKDRGYEPGQGDGFLRAIKIRSTPSFGWEVKPEVPCRKILRHVKDLF
jgi:hypothetical protein